MVAGRRAKVAPFTDLRDLAGDELAAIDSSRANVPNVRTGHGTGGGGDARPGANEESSENSGKRT